MQSGTLAASRQKISCRVNSVSSWSIRLNRAIFSLNIAPENVPNTGSLSMDWTASPFAIAFR